MARNVTHISMCFTFAYDYVIWHIERYTFIQKWSLRMNTSKIQLERCFLCSIDFAKSFVDYNEYVIDLDGEMCQYMLQLFARNFDNTSAKRSSFSDDSFLATILPESVEGFDAFVDVIADEIHSLVQEAVDLPSGSGLFLWATVEEQPIIAFFKLNYLNKFACLVDEDNQVKWQKVYRLLPSHAGKDYDYFFINIYDKKVWMSDTKCHIDNTSLNYMADRILKLEIKLSKSEKEVVNVIEKAALDTIRECYKEKTPEKVFEYRERVADEAADYGNISPLSLEQTVFADNEDAQNTYKEKLKELDISEKPVAISKKTTRALQKKQKIVTENGIEILVPIEFLDDSSIFEYHEDPSGKVSIVINDVSGNLK